MPRERIADIADPVDTFHITYELPWAAEYINEYINEEARAPRNRDARNNEWLAIRDNPELRPDMREIIKEPINIFRKLRITQRYVDACVTCTVCGLVFFEGYTAVIAEGNTYHTECANLKLRCSECLSLFPTNQRPLGQPDKIICNRCAGNKVNCADCGRLTNRNQAFTFVRHEGAYCHYCATYCSHCDRVHLLQDMYSWRGTYYCESCMTELRYIRGHYFNPLEELEFLGNPKDKMYFGVELEVECGIHKFEYAKILTENLKDFAIIKHDGSLEQGFEIVSAPADMKTHYKLWHKYFDLLDNKENPLQIESWSSQRCGMHVHISRKALTPMQVARMMVFMYSARTRQLIEDIAGRNLHDGWGARYAEINSHKKLTDCVEVTGTENWVHTQLLGPEWRRLIAQGRRLNPFDYDYLKETYKKKQLKLKNPNNGNRYTALNDVNQETIEIRIFRGCNKRSTLFKNLEFCRAITQYCLPIKTSLSEIDNPENFLGFLDQNRKEYPYLYRFLTRHGHIMTKKVAGAKSV